MTTIEANPANQPGSPALRIPRPLNAIFVDLDGVLADFHTDMARLWDVDAATLDQAASAELGEWGLGVPKDDFWPRIQAEGAAFWRNLGKLPWTDRLWAACQAACERVIVLTTPGPFPESAAGKYAWVREQLGTTKMLIGSPKDVCSGPGHILIDDRVGYTRQWEAAGGVMVPLRRPWTGGGYEVEAIIAALQRAAL